MKINYSHPSLKYYDINGNYMDGDECVGDHVLQVNGRYEVCPVCGGEGSHFRSDLDENHLVDSMREDCDEDGLEAYFSGAFDQTCSECNGKRVVAVPELPEWAEKAIEEWGEAEREYRSTRDAECRVGA
jgi:hypothetical protein